MNNDNIVSYEIDGVEKNGDLRITLKKDDGGRYLGWYKEVEKESISKKKKIYDIFTELSIFIVLSIWAVLGVTSIIRVISTEIVCHTVADTKKELVMMCIEED